MLVLHSADAVLPGAGQPMVPAGAVLVEGARLLAVGDAEALADAHPRARPRRWSGLLAPGLVNVHAVALLEAAYHPDPREADELGVEPLTGRALAVLAPDAARWGASARRGVQRMLRYGTTAVTGVFRRPEVRVVVARSGLALLRRPPGDGEPSLDPLASGALQDALAGELVPGGRADLAVFAGPERRHCVATVLAGRLVHRAR